MRILSRFRLCDRRKRLDWLSGAFMIVTREMPSRRAIGTLSLFRVRVQITSALLPAAWVARWCCLAVKKPQALKQHYRYVKELRLLQDEQDGKK